MLTIRSNSEQDGRYNGNTVRAAVGAGTGSHDYRVKEAVAQLLPEPHEIAYVGGVGDAGQLYLNCHDAPIPTLDNYVNCVITIPRPQMVQRCLMRLGIDPDAKGDERLEQRPRESAQAQSG